MALAKAELSNMECLGSVAHRVWAKLLELYQEAHNRPLTDIRERFALLVEMNCHIIDRHLDL